MNTLFAYSTLVYFSTKVFVTKRTNLLEMALLWQSTLYNTLPACICYTSLLHHLYHSKHKLSCLGGRMHGVKCKWASGQGSILLLPQSNTQHPTNGCLGTGQTLLCRHFLQPTWLKYGLQFLQSKNFHGFGVNVIMVAKSVMTFSMEFVVIEPLMTLRFL